MHGTLDLGIGDTRTYKESEPNIGEEHAKPGQFAHQQPHSLILLGLAIAQVDQAC